MKLAQKVVIVTGGGGGIGGALAERLAQEGARVLATVLDYANDLAAHCSPQPMATIKSQMQRDADACYTDAATRADQLMLEAFHGADVVEGVASHLDKRPPSFPSLPVRSSHVPV